MGSFSVLLMIYAILHSSSVQVINANLGSVETTDSSDDDGFSVDLIHYDSPRSPFYDASETPADRALKAIRRSHSRLSYFKTVVTTTKASPPNLVSTVVPGAADNDYLMTINIGTPPVKRVVIADTGSGLNWVQCKPCKACFKQDYPLFDPRKSSSYRALDCKSDLCQVLPKDFRSCGPVNSHCRFNYSYGDNSVTQGEVGTETFTFETTKKTTVVRIPRVALGCSYYTQGKFNSVETGLAGLGNTKTSLVNQIGPFVSWRFSYCLVPHTLTKASSVLSFGKAATVTGPRAVSVPYIPQIDTVYAVNLTKISIGKKSIHLIIGSESTVILDSGTHLTILPTRVVKKMVYAVAAILGDGNVVEDPTDTFALCYPSVHSVESKLPSMTFRFGDGGVVVGPANLFKKVSHNVTCLAVVPNDGLSILGNLFMANHKYGYDIKLHTITIAPADCTKRI